MSWLTARKRTSGSPARPTRTSSPWPSSRTWRRSSSSTAASRTRLRFGKRGRKTSSCSRRRNPAFVFAGKLYNLLAKKGPLRTFKADLHIHTCLSPCADVEMSPRRIAEEAAKERPRHPGRLRPQFGGKRGRGGRSRRPSRHPRLSRPGDHVPGRGPRPGFVRGAGIGPVDAGRGLRPS